MHYKVAEQHSTLHHTPPKLSQHHTAKASLGMLTLGNNLAQTLRSQF